VIRKSEFVAKTHFLCKTSLLMIVDEFNICYGATNIVIKPDLKITKIWTTLVLKRSCEKYEIAC